MQDITQAILARVCRIEAASRPYAAIPFDDASQADSYLATTRRMILEHCLWNAPGDMQSMCARTFGKAATPALVEFIESLF